MAVRKTPTAAMSASTKALALVTLEELERFAIQRALSLTNGSISDAAKLLGIGRATLYRRPGLFRPQPPLRGKKATAADAILTATHSNRPRPKTPKQLEAELRALCIQLGPRKARAILAEVEQQLKKTRG